MAGVERSIDLRDLVPWLRQLSQETVARYDWTRAFKGIALLLESDAKACFAHESSPQGLPWARLKRPRPTPKTMRGPNAARGERQRILRDKGILAASLTANGAHHIEQVTPTTLVFGSNLEYAAIHNYGGEIKKPERKRGPNQKPWVFADMDGVVVFTRRIRAHTIKIPARPFLAITDRLADDIGQLLIDDWTRMWGNLA